MCIIIIVILLVLLLLGCIVMFGNVLVDVVGLVGFIVFSVCVMMFNLVQNFIVYSKDLIYEVCIEWNGLVVLSDFVFGLQGELQKYGVQSCVYDVGIQLLVCLVMLSYVGYVKWDIKVFIDVYIFYFIYVVLILCCEGCVLGMVQYWFGFFGQDKWVSVGDKLVLLIDVLFLGNLQVVDNLLDNMCSVVNGF